mgnify:FL=1
MKRFIVHFNYDSWRSNTQEVAVVFANNRDEATTVFKNEIYKVFNSYEDTCTISAVSELSDGISLVYTRGGTVWAK